MIEDSHHCWYDLNIDVNDALIKDWTWQGSYKSDIRKYSAGEIFSESWLNTLNKLHISVTGSLVHHKPSWFCDVDCHVDSYTNSSSCFGINWVIGGAGSEMIWYEMPPNTADRVPYTTPAGTPYIAWPIKGLKEIDRCEIKSSAVLVRVDQPHSIIVREHSRLSISARTNMRVLSWSSVVNYLLKKNLLIPRD